MDQHLIEALSQRDAAIVERQKSLTQEYDDLEDEHQHIAALLEKYRTFSTNTPPSSSVSYQEASPSVSYREDVQTDHSQSTQKNDLISSKPKTRHSPGEAEKHIDKILSRGESHSIISLARRIMEIFGIQYPDSTIGVTLRRGLDQGKYKRDGNIWTMILGQSQREQQPEETLIENNKQGNTDNDEHPLLAAMRMEDFENNV